jgi:hypothetical protein
MLWERYISSLPQTHKISTVDDTTIDLFPALDPKMAYSTTLSLDVATVKETIGGEQNFRDGS